nr:DUF664 domain-containing protein [Streptomyces anulatus]
MILIEEISRHNGHLDVVRELIDGQTGVQLLPGIPGRRQSRLVAAQVLSAMTSVTLHVDVDLRVG